MKDERVPDAPDDDAVLPRLFIRDPDWQVRRKRGSDREFCFTISPGHDSYHRISDGELYLVKGDEKLCVPCASRRGLLVFEPRVLREPVVPVSLDTDAPGGSSDYELRT